MGGVLPRPRMVLLRRRQSGRQASRLQRRHSGWRAFRFPSRVGYRSVRGNLALVGLNWWTEPHGQEKGQEQARRWQEEEDQEDQASLKGEGRESNGSRGRGRGR